MPLRLLSLLATRVPPPVMRTFERIEPLLRAFLPG
jgi:hypothetical protein